MVAGSMAVAHVEEGSRVSVLGHMGERYNEILTPAALKFLGELHVRFNKTRCSLLEARMRRQAEIDQGKFPEFLEETEFVRKGDWKVAPIPGDLQDRRVEITGPVDRKMVINALNSGASCFMADFEDSSSPTWSTMVEGQINMFDAVRKTISLEANGKQYKLKESPATLLVRPRGWHLLESHVLVNGEQMSGSLFDFGLYFFHNAKEALRRGTGPYFYLPKMESHREARLWNDVFIFAQNYIGVPIGTIRATVLIETILASFEMDEILYELKEHSGGLNCGRWDYIFSFIKRFRSHKDFVLPDRSLLTMTVPFMEAYVKLLVQTCHRRGIHAMGGMAAQIPVKNDKEKNDRALASVKKDKEREVLAGHDGTWVAHPALIPIAKEVFDKNMPTANQISNIPSYAQPVTARDLICVPSGKITRAGVVENVYVSLVYLEAWLRGVGCIPVHHKMEDAATAEIARSQVWQWVKHGASMDDGAPIDENLISNILKDEIAKCKTAGVKNDRFDLAGQLLRGIFFDDDFAEFITLPAYPHIVKVSQSKL